MADYLVHFNMNHDKLGRFTAGDGDGKPNKINKYQYADGTLTPAGKQRWAQQYVKDVKKAKRRGEDVTKVTTEIESDKWSRHDTAKNIFSTLWFINTVSNGGVWFRTSRKRYSEQSIDEFLKTHSGNSVYAEGKGFAEKIINDLDKAPLTEARERTRTTSKTTFSYGNKTSRDRFEPNNRKPRGNIS